jgi:hypothetical protein
VLALVSGLSALAQEQDSARLLTNQIAPEESFFITRREIFKARQSLKGMDIDPLTKALQTALLSDECSSLLEAIFKNEGIVPYPLTLEQWADALKIIRAQQAIDDVLYVALGSQVQSFIRRSRPPLVDEEGNPVEEGGVDRALPSLNACEVAQSVVFVREHLAHHERTSFLGQRIKKLNVPRQVALYQKFSSTQVIILSELYQKFTDRIAATNAEIRLSYSNGTQEIIPLSPMEQYRMAQRLLHKEIEELKLSQIFNGTKVTYEDIVTSALETGMIKGSDVETVLKVDDLWSPKKTTWQKIMSIVQRVGGPAMILVPPPFSQYVSMGMILIQSLGQKKKSDPLSDGVAIF